MEVADGDGGEAVGEGGGLAGVVVTPAADCSVGAQGAGVVVADGDGGVARRGYCGGSGSPVGWREARWVNSGATGRGGRCEVLLSKCPFSGV